jgi:hypothetical protein
MAENPLPAELPRLLTRTLLSIEGLRRSAEPTDDDWKEATEALDTFHERQENLVHRSIAEPVREAVNGARQALENRQIEDARESLLEVGRLLDRHVKSQRGGPEDGP